MDRRRPKLIEWTKVDLIRHLPKLTKLTEVNLIGPKRNCLIFRENKLSLIILEQKL